MDLNVPANVVAARRAVRGALQIFPLTPGGVALLGACEGLWVYGVARRQDVLLAMAVPALAAVLVVAVLTTALASVAALYAARSGRTREFLDLEVGVASSTGFSFPFPWWLPLVEIEGEWLDVPGAVEFRRHGSRVEEVFTPERRGVLESVTRILVVRDLLGLARLRLRVK